MSYKNFMRTYPQFERYFTEWQVTAYLLCVTLSRMSIADRNKADGRKIMKILHIGREENMERYPAPDYIAEEIETVSLPREEWISRFFMYGKQTIPVLEARSFLI